MLNPPPALQPGPTGLALGPERSLRPGTQTLPREPPGLPSSQGSPHASMGALNVPCALKVLSPPEWLVDEGKERRWEERDPPGLVTPIYWPSDPHLPACFAGCQSPCGHITGAPETAALQFCTPGGLGEHSWGPGSLTLHALAERNRSQPGAPLSGYVGSEPGTLPASETTGVSCSLEGVWATGETHIQEN